MRRVEAYSTSEMQVELVVRQLDAQGRQTKVVVELTLSEATQLYEDIRSAVRATAQEEMRA